MVGEGHNNRTHREVAQKFLKSLRYWIHGYCLPRTPGHQALCVCFTVPRLIFSSTLWGKDCWSHFAAGETSLHLLLGRFSHPLASAANCLPPCSQHFRFLPHPPTPAWGLFLSAPSAPGSRPLSLCPMAGPLAFPR